MLRILVTASTLGLAALMSQASASNCEIEEYDHNGSLMEVQICDSDLVITYLRPRSGLPVSGGTRLFEGRVSSIGSISGQSRLFSAGCGEITYDVEGAVRPNSILLSGKAPVRNANCKVTRYRDDELLFTRQAAAAPRTVAPRPAAPRASTDDWYAIAGAFGDFAGAAERVSELPSGWAVKNSNECRNFRNGFWIAAIGPLSKSDADAWSSVVPREFQPYVKSCN